MLLVAVTKIPDRNNPKKGGLVLFWLLVSDRFHSIPMVLRVARTLTLEVRAWPHYYRQEAALYQNKG